MCCMMSMRLLALYGDFEFASTSVSFTRCEHHACKAFAGTMRPQRHTCMAILNMNIVVVDHIHREAQASRLLYPRDAQLTQATSALCKVSHGSSSFNCFDTQQLTRSRSQPNDSGYASMVFRQLDRSNSCGPCLSTLVHLIAMRL